MNTVDNSKNMAQELQTPAVRDWLQDWLRQDGKGQSAAAVHPGTSGRHQQRHRPGQRQAPPGRSRRRPPPRHHQRRHFRRRHRFPLPQRRGLSGGPQKPHRRHPGGGPGYAHRPRQGIRLHHLPHPDPAQRQPRKLGSNPAIWPRAGRNWAKSSSPCAPTTSASRITSPVCCNSTCPPPTRK